MTDQPKSFIDIRLEALNLTIALRNIARHYPEATHTEHLSSIASQDWTVADLIERVSAIHDVLGFIAETPNGYINREALDGLSEQFKAPMEFLNSEWAKQALDEAARSFFEGGPDPKQRRDRLHQAAPRLLEAIRNTLEDENCALDYERQVLLWAAITEATGEEPKLAD